jgi:hypothetical protein
MKPEIKLNDDEILKMARHALTMPGRYDIYKGIDGTGNFVRRH